MAVDLQNLVQAARDDGPSAAESARLQALVMARVAAAPVAPPGPAAHLPTQTATPGVKLVVSVKGLVAGALGLTLLAFGGGFWLGQQPPSAQLAVPAAPPAVRSVSLPDAAQVGEVATAPQAPATLPAPAKLADEPNRPVSPTFPQGTPRAVLPPASEADLALAQAALDEPPSPPSPDGPAATSSLAAELALLRRAQESLRDGDSSQTLRLLTELDRSFPGGVLGAERDALRVVSLCAAERSKEARAAAERFRKQYPNSPYAARVDASCVGPR